MALVQQEQLIAILLANEAYTLPPALLEHVKKGTLYTKKLEAVAAQLDSAWFISHLPQLPKDGELSVLACAWLDSHGKLQAVQL